MPCFVSKCFERSRSEKYVRKIMEIYTSASAHLAIPKNLPTHSRTWGKKVKVKSPSHTERNTKK
jgi:hypothetical protein